MIIVQISDTHILGPGENAPVGAGRAENLQRCVANINSLNPLPDAVFHTGDITEQGLDEEFALAREILSVLKPPLFVTPGNRDGRAGMFRAFTGETYFPENQSFFQYVVDSFPVRMVVVDSLGPNGRKGDFCEDRLSALDKTLGEDPDRSTALFLHHPPFEIIGISDPFLYERREAVGELIAVLARHPQVIRLFCSHAHRPQMSVVGGVLSSIAPPIAVDLPKRTYSEAMAAIPVYQVHRFDGKGTFSNETRWPTD